MKQLVGKIGTALLTIWAVGMTTILIIGASSDGPIDGPEQIGRAHV